MRHPALNALLLAVLAPVAPALCVSPAVPPTVLGLRQDPAQVSPPDAAAVSAALERLDKAFKKGDGPARIAAIEAAREVLDGEVIGSIARGLRDREVDVVRATLEALRFMPHPEALEQLHKTYKRDKKLRKDEESFALLVKAIGQHGKADSIEVLSDDPFGVRAPKVATARILGLGNIRDPRSVEELIGLMRLAGRHRVQEHMQSFRLALMILTSADEGESQDGWTTWWNEHKKDLVIAPDPPKLPQRFQRRWDYFWGNERARSRDKKRGDRGNDPEGPDEPEAPREPRRGGD